MDDEHRVRDCLVIHGCWMLLMSRVVMDNRVVSID